MLIQLYIYDTYSFIKTANFYFAKKCDVLLKHAYQNQCILKTKSKNI